MAKKLKHGPGLRQAKPKNGEFWEKHDTADYFDLSKAVRVRFPNLEACQQRQSRIRLPTDHLEQIKVAANKRDVPYQSLIKMWLARRWDSARLPPL